MTIILGRVRVIIIGSISVLSLSGHVDSGLGHIGSILLSDRNGLFGFQFYFGSLFRVEKRFDSGISGWVNGYGYILPASEYTLLLTLTQLF